MAPDASIFKAYDIRGIVDETLTANMLYNGSSITGKAQAGATITINIEE